MANKITERTKTTGGNGMSYDKRKQQMNTTGGDMEMDQKRVRSIEEGESIRNTLINLTERKLLADNVFSTFEVVKEKDEKGKEKILSKKELTQKVEKLEFDLIPVSEKELSVIRNMVEEPYLVLKDSGNYWYAKIPKKMSFLGQKALGCEHKCGTCKRLLATSDAEGGCAKVRDIGETRYIENYPFITMGYQSKNNTPQPTFFVAECDHYRKERKS